MFQKLSNNHIRQTPAQNHQQAGGVQHDSCLDAGRTCKATRKSQSIDHATVKIDETNSDRTTNISLCLKLTGQPSKECTSISFRT